MDLMRVRPWSLWLLLAIFAVSAECQAQFAPNRQQTEDLFLMAPRSMTRLLREGEAAIADGRFADGVTALGALLLDDSVDVPEDLRGQDFFVEAGNRGLYQKSVNSC